MGKPPKLDVSDAFRRICCAHLMMNNKREAQRQESDFELYERTSIRPTQALRLEKEEP